MTTNEMYNTSHAHVHRLKQNFSKWDKNGPCDPKEPENIICNYDDVLGDVLRPSRGTTPAAVTVSGHKCFIKFRIPIDLRVFPCLLFNFL